MKSKKCNLLIFIIFICLHGNTLLFAATQEFTYKDSITGSIVVFPDALDIKTKKQSSFERATVEYEKSDVLLYFMISLEKERFSWERINDFDKGDEYGKFISSEPLEKTEGFIRIYKKDNYFTQIALIRGDYYACYLVESCYNSNDFHLKEIIDKSHFAKADFKQEKTDWDKEFGIILLISLILILSSLILKKRKYNGWFWFVVILGIPIGFCLYTWLFADYAFILCIVPALILFLISLGIWGSDSWKDMKNYLIEMYNNIIENI